MKQQALAKYQEQLKRWQEKGQMVPDLRPVTTQDTMVVAMSLHRCNNPKFKDITLQLLEFLLKEQVITSDDVLNAGICTKPAFYRRMEILRKSSIIRRVSRMYYIATPRLPQFLEYYKRLSRI